MGPAASRSIVILTGAGISAESGLPTFRDNGGLWEQHRVEDVATPEAFRRNPELVQRFYNERRRRLGDVSPNAAHHALVALEQGWPGPLLLVTQNVDDLHARVGSRNLIPMHGELLKARCLACGAVSTWMDDILPESRCPHCDLQRQLRPHIVWFGEMPLEMNRIFAALENCGLFVAIGTSGTVYPAAGFVNAVPPGTRTIEINLEFPESNTRFVEQRRGSATERVPELVSELLK
ncbi:MAG: NAD-dependent deacylase [Holophagaceae bacterium]|nr:NAD-dependent deacylase [Holophagaceae bacterium]